jgi:hypothetical protein
MESYNHGGKPGLAAPDAPALFDLAGAVSLVADAVALTELTPEKKSALVAQATQSREQIEQLNSATGAFADKAFLTLRAMLALKGHALSRTHAEDSAVRFSVTRWGLVREFPDLPSVRAFAEQVGAKHA